MQCNICPLFSRWKDEGESGEACALFGDGWNSQFQYERNNQIWGCYIEKAYINKVEQRIEKHRAEEVKAFLEEVDNDQSRTYEFGREKGSSYFQRRG